MKFCEYCGSENSLYALRCHACNAPFSIRAVRIREDVAGEETEIYYPAQLGMIMASLTPLILIVAVAGWARERGRALIGWCCS